MRCRKPGCSRVSVYSLLTFPSELPHMQKKTKRKTKTQLLGRRDGLTGDSPFDRRRSVGSLARCQQTNTECRATQYVLLRDRCLAMAGRAWIKVNSEHRLIWKRGESRPSRCWAKKQKCQLITRRYRKRETSDNMLMLSWNRTASLSWVTPWNYCHSGIISYQQNNKRTSHLHSNFSVN